MLLFFVGNVLSERGWDYHVLKKIVNHVPTKLFSKLKVPEATMKLNLTKCLNLSD